MGSTFSQTTRVADTTNQEVRGESNLNLEAQKIKDFTGGYKEWQKWKSRTECAFSGSGYERILDDADFATTNVRLNQVVYSQLVAATVDGVAYHLVQRFEHDKNGHAAWKNLCDWYDGDTIQNETAEKLQNKLDNLRLHSGVSGSEYVNKFLAWYRDLEKGEGLSPGHAKQLFLKNITDGDYQTSVAYCRNMDCTLEKCIAALRKQERKSNRKSWTGTGSKQHCVECVRRKTATMTMMPLNSSLRRRNTTKHAVWKTKTMKKLKTQNSKEN